MRRRLVLVFCLALGAQVLSCLNLKTWELNVRFGRGRVEGKPDGSMLAYFLAIRDPDDATADSGASVLVDWEGLTNPVRVTQGSTPFYAGWLFHTDLRTFPRVEVVTTFETPEGDTVDERRSYTGNEPLLDYPELTVDTSAGVVIVSIGPVDGAASYLMRVTTGDDAFQSSEWRSEYRGTAFTDTIPAGTFTSGQVYRLWGVVGNIDMPAIQANPEQMPELPVSFAYTQSQGPSFTAP
jgi:hypothetical protein